MEEIPHIVVIMPTYWCRDWLARAIDSIIHQTWKRVDLYVIDDGGHDVDEQLAAHFKQVTFVRLRERIGPFRAANLILSMTDSDFVAFQDADDWSRPDRLAIQMQCVERENCDGCGSWYVMVDIHGDPIGFETCPSNASSALEERLDHFLFHPTALYSRRVFDRVVGFDGNSLGADTEFFWRASLSHRFRNVARFLYYQTIRPASLTQSATTGHMSRDRLRYIEEIRAAAEAVRAGKAPIPDPGVLLTGQKICRVSSDLLEWIRPGERVESWRGPI